MEDPYSDESLESWKKDIESHKFPEPISKALMRFVARIEDDAKTIDSLRLEVENLEGTLQQIGEWD